MGKARDAVGAVLSGLRERLSLGQIAPGEVIDIADTARAYRISVTPVREALARLAGEGLLTGARRVGYARPRRSAEELAGLYAFHHALLLSALELSGGALGGAKPLDGVEGAEALFAQLTAAAGNAPLSAARARTIEALGPARRAERDLLPDLEAEAHALRRAVERGDRDLREALRVYHGRRISQADPLARAQH